MPVDESMILGVILMCMNSGQRGKVIGLFVS